MDKKYIFKDTWFEITNIEGYPLMWLLLDKITLKDNEYKIYKGGLEIASFRKIKVLEINEKEFEIKLDVE